MRISLSPSRARLPYSGHIQLVLRRGDAQLEIAARMAQSQAPEQAWDALLALQALLEQVDGEDRHGLMESLWRTLQAADPSTLGPTRAQDLSLLAIATDPSGALVSGLGMERVEGLSAKLPSATGIPEQAPPILQAPQGALLAHCNQGTP